MVAPLSVKRHGGMSWEAAVRSEQCTSRSCSLCEKTLRLVFSLRPKTWFFAIPEQGSGWRKKNHSEYARKVCGPCLVDTKAGNSSALWGPSLVRVGCASQNILWTFLIRTCYFRTSRKNGFCHTSQYIFRPQHSRGKSGIIKVFQNLIE